MKKALGLAVIMLFVGSTSVFGQAAMGGDSHDFSSTGPAVNPNLTETLYDDQICVVCHAPHLDESDAVIVAYEATYLWNRANSDATTYSMYDSNTIDGAQDAVPAPLGSNGNWSTLGREYRFNVALEQGSGREFKITEIDFNGLDSSATITWTSRPGTIYAIDASSDMKTWAELDDGIEGAAGSETTSFTEKAIGQQKLHIENTATKKDVEQAFVYHISLESIGEQYIKNVDEILWDMNLTIKRGYEMVDEAAGKGIPSLTVKIETLTTENAGFAMKERSELEVEYNNAFPDTKPEDLKEMNNSTMRTEIRTFNKVTKKYEALLKKGKEDQAEEEVNNSTNGSRTTITAQTGSTSKVDPITQKINNRIDGFGGHN